MSTADERGSTIPLILAFFLVALTMVAGAIAAGAAFVQQRGLQALCDGAAASAAAEAADLRRGAGLGSGDALRFTDVRQAVARYLARDPSRGGVRVAVALSADARTLTLTCSETAPVAFGAMFGKGGGVHHIVRSSARAPLS